MMSNTAKKEMLSSSSMTPSDRVVHKAMRERPVRPIANVVRGRSGILGGNNAPTVAPDTADSQTYATLIDVVSEGPCLGLADVVHGGSGAKSIFFDNTPLQNEDGTYNFSTIIDSNGNTIHVPVEWGYTLGTPTQNWLPGFSDSEEETSVNAEVFNANGPLIRRTSNPSIDAIVVTLEIPLAYFQDPKGNLYVVGIGFSIDYRPVGTSTWLPFQGSPGSWVGKTSSGVQIQYYQLVRTNLTEQLYDVRVTRNSPDHDNGQNAPSNVVIQDRLIWFSFTEIVESKFMYPNTAYVGIQAPAVVFGGQLPTRTFDWYGRIVRIPSNYTPTQYDASGNFVAAAVYSGIWNGTFSTGWTDNPAWCLLDMLTTGRYGLNLPDSFVDIAALYTISQYCDELVSDNFGGLQPRYTMNVQINSQQEAYDLINQMCSAFLGMVYYSSGMVTFTQDSPRDVDMVVVPANVVDGNFEWQTQSIRGTPNTVVASWQNPLLNWSTDYVSVEDTPQVASTGQTRIQTVSLFGVTDQGRALRMARWALYTQLFNGTVCTFQAGLDHADIVPGMVIAVQDPQKAGASTGGRIVASNPGAGTVTLDRSVLLTSGHSYTLYLLNPDKSVGQYQVLTTSEGQETANLSLNVVFSQDVTGAVWAIYDNAVPPTLIRVVTRRQISNVSFEMTGILYYPNKYSLIENGAALDVNEYVSPTVNPVLPPTNMQVVEKMVLNANGTVTDNALVGWTASLDSRTYSYTVQLQGPDGQWTTLGTTRGVTMNYTVVTPGTFNIRVKANTILGQSSSWLNQTFIFEGLNAPPSDVTDFVITVVGDQATLSWDPSPDLNFDHWELRFSSVTSGADWQSSSQLLNNVTSTSVQVPSLSGTYMIKAVNHAGVYSPDFESVVSTIASLVQTNTVDTIAEQPSWGGTKTDVGVTGGDLELSGSQVIADWTKLSEVSTLAFGTAGFQLSGTYVGTTFDAGNVYVIRVIPSLQAAGDKFDDPIGNWTTLAAVTTLSGVAVGDWSVTFEMRFSNDGVTWGGWQPAVLGDYSFRMCQPRLTLTSNYPDLTPLVSLMQMQYTIPDRLISGNALSVSSAGLSVSFNPAYKSLQGLGIVIENGAQGDYYSISSKSVSGFTVQLFNSSGVAKSGVISYVASGFGSVV